MPHCGRRWPARHHSAVAGLAAAAGPRQPV